MHPHPQDFVPTHPIAEAADGAGDAEDPHLAGVAAQTRYLEQCRAQGLQASVAELDEAYWSAYKTTSQWGDL